MHNRADLNEVLLFVEVVRAGSITAGARALDLPKSTVSRKLSQLEERLGVRLLKRTTRQLQTTEAGEAYFERCQRVVEALDEADDILTELSRKPRGRLRLSMPLEFAVIWMAPYLAEFAQLYPDIHLDLDVSARQTDIIGENYDLAIRIGPLPDSSLVARELVRATRHIYASPDYLARHGTPASPDELTRHNCIVTPVVGNKWTFRRGRETLDVHVRGNIVANNISLISQFAQAGLGIAQVPDTYVRSAVEQGQLVPLLTEYALPEGVVLIVMPGRGNLPAKTRVFLDFLMSRVSRL